MAPQARREIERTDGRADGHAGHAGGALGRADRQRGIHRQPGRARLCALRTVDAGIGMTANAGRADERHQPGHRGQCARDVGECGAH